MAQTLTLLQAPLMAAEGSKQLVSGKVGAAADGGSNETCPLLSLQEQPKWSWSLMLAGFGATVGAAVPVGYCTGVVNSPAVVSSCASR